MALFTGNNVSSGSIIYASDHNTLVNLIAASLNNIEAAQIASNAVTTPKIADNGVTMAKHHNPYSFRAYKSSAQTPSAGAFTKIQLNAEDFDVNSNYDNATNYEYSAPVAGQYFFRAKVSFASSTTSIVIPAFYKNGTVIDTGSDVRTGVVNRAVEVTSILQLAVSDKITFYVYTDAAVALDVASAYANVFSGFLINQT